jgi:tryptophan-rich sensory protein
MLVLTFIVVAVTLLTASLGAWITRSGLEWYRTIHVPSWTPSGKAIGRVWTVIYTLTAVSAMLSLRAADSAQFPMLAALFGVNAFLNAAWSYLFFGQRQLGSAVLDSGLLALSIVVLIVTVVPLSILAAALLVPYLLWVIFATGLTYAIFRLNP